MKKVLCITTPAMLVWWIVAAAFCSSFAEPGGSYTLTGKETGVEAIVRADMEQYPELYKGETFKGYLAKFKAENKIGRRKFNPGDQLRFPETKASIRQASAKPSLKGFAKIAKVKVIERDYNRFKNKSDIFYIDGLTQSGVFVLRDVPEEYSGYKFTIYSRFGNYRGPPLVFEVKEPGMVYLVSDNNNRELPSNGWEKIAKATAFFGNRKLKVPLAIYQKELEKGVYELSTVGQFGTRVLWK